MAAVTRYDAISRIARKSSMVETDNYDWEGMLATGRNLYGNPDQCIEIDSQCHASLLLRHVNHDFQFRRYPPRRNQKIHAPLRQRSHAGLSLSRASQWFR